MTRKQAIRGAREREERTFDRTSLRSTAHGLWIHRDYAAHFFRWGFAKRFIDAKTSVLDFGCGAEAPLVNVLTPSLSHVPRSYVGVDLNKLPNVPSRQWATFYGGFDLTSADAVAKLVKKHGLFDVVVSLEVIEHMSVAHGRKLLRNARAALASGGTFLLSTPVFNGKAARNHIHEYRIDELQAEIEKAGFTIASRFGTFSRQAEMKDAASPTEWAVFQRLRVYYDDDVIACFLAPLYPDASRNCIWVLERDDEPKELEPAEEATPASTKKKAPWAAATPANPRATSKGYIRSALVAHNYVHERPPKEWAARIAAEVRERFGTKEKPRTTQAGDVYFVWKNMQGGGE